MKEANVWSYVNVGTGFRYLQDAKVGWKVHGAGNIVVNIERFLDSLDRLGLKVTRRVARDLEVLNASLKSTPTNHTLTIADTKKLRDVVVKVRPAFSAEAQGLYVFVATDKRLDLDKLFNRVEDLFGPEIFAKLPTIAQYDFQEAGRCIVFERATAAGFHLLRGTEAVLGAYYRYIFRKPGINLTWGQMTTQLKNKTRGRLPDSPTVNHLDHIRVAFRNPTQHPEKIYDIQEVQDLWGICVDVVNRMTAHLKVQK